MKVITHGNALRFTCPRCACIFQATKNEKCVEWKDFGVDMPRSSGYFAACPECGEEEVRGYEIWRKETTKED